MVIKVYISGISGNHEIRKQQQRVLFILSSLKIEFEVIDITEIGKENEREFMRTQCKLHNKENPLPPQIFNDETYCGDYEDFETANEDDQLSVFLKLDNADKGNGVTSQKSVDIFPILFVSPSSRIYVRSDDKIYRTSGMKGFKKNNELPRVDEESIKQKANSHYNN